jgi:ABC-type dipeptide/oligopeptide/nickel transport system ATPase subunit
MTMMHKANYLMDPSLFHPNIVTLTHRNRTQFPLCKTDIVQQKPKSHLNPLMRIENMLEGLQLEKLSQSLQLEKSQAMHRSTLP